MEKIRQTLEFPLPVLAVGVKELTIEAKGEQDTAFFLRNSVSGGLLSGRVFSDAPCLSFEPSEWEGNRQEIICRFAPKPEEGWKPGDVRTFSITILSNGGEVHLPVTIRLAKMAITTEEGITIANLQDFFAYCESHPSEAQELFADSEFHMLLLAMDFPYTDAYTLLVKEPNRARALDNFLILADLKKRTTMQSVSPAVEHKTLENVVIKGSFQIQKSDSGYIEAGIKTQGGAKWLSLSSDTISSADFDSDNIAEISYTIDPLLIEGRYARERVLFTAEDAALDIIFKRPIPLEASLAREAYTYKDSGELILENQTKEPMQIEIFCKENFIRFQQNQYRLDGQLSLKIPFFIKLPPLQAAQMLFRKIPYMPADIEITTSYKGQVIKKNVRLTAGEW